MKVDSAVWKLGSWIAAIRLLALASMVIGFRYADWRQVAGYFCSFLFLPEALVFRHFRNDQPTWTLCMAVLIFFASYLYAAIIVHFRRSMKQP